MPSLMNLPDELLEQIVLDVADQDRLALYRDIVYVNKTLNRIASPHVARHSPIHSLNLPAPPTPTHLLLLHLFRHPRQARNVRTLVADSDEGPKIHPCDWRAYCERFMGGESFDRIADVAKETSPALASSSDWCNELGRGSVDASDALLLALCTRIVRLDYRLQFFCPDATQNMTLRLITLAVKNMMADTTLSLHPFAQLEHVVLRAPRANCPSMQDISYAAPFFHLPKLKSLATEGLGTTSWGPLRDVNDDEPCRVQGWRGGVALDPDLYISQFPVGTSPIETLILDRAFFISTGLLVLIRACKRLKKPVIHINRVNILELECLEVLSEAIAHHSSSLEEVTVRLVDDQSWNQCCQHDWKTGGIALYDCLKNMERLKRLTIHIDFLYRQVTAGLWDFEVELATDRLPPSLEHLVLEDYRDANRELIPTTLKRYQRLLEECGPDGKFSKLRSLTMPFDVTDHRGQPVVDDEELEGFEALAEFQGVQLMFDMECRYSFDPMAPEPYPFLPRQRGL